MLALREYFWDEWPPHPAPVPPEVKKIGGGVPRGVVTVRLPRLEPEPPAVVPEPEPEPVYAVVHATAGPARVLAHAGIVVAAMAHGVLSIVAQASGHLAARQAAHGSGLMDVRYRAALRGAQAQAFDLLGYANGVTGHAVARSVTHLTARPARARSAVDQLLLEELLADEFF